MHELAQARMNTCIRLRDPWVCPPPCHSPTSRPDAACAGLSIQANSIIIAKQDNACNSTIPAAAAPCARPEALTSPVAREEYVQPPAAATMSAATVANGSLHRLLPRCLNPVVATAVAAAEVITCSSESAEGDGVGWKGSASAFPETISRDQIVLAGFGHCQAACSAAARQCSELGRRAMLCRAA